jgi:hypothetical protein
MWASSSKYVTQLQKKTSKLGIAVLNLWKSKLDTNFSDQKEKPVSYSYCTMIAVDASIIV